MNASGKEKRTEGIALLDASFSIQCPLAPKDETGATKAPGRQWYEAGAMSLDAIQACAAAGDGSDLLRASLFHIAGHHACPQRSHILNLCPTGEADKYFHTVNSKATTNVVYIPLYGS